MRELTPQTVMLSALYVITTILCLLLLNFALGYVLDNFIFNMLEWFNRQSILLQVIIFFVGGVSVIALLFSIVQFAAALVSGLLFRYFPYNGFTMVSGLILSLANIVFLTISLWKAFPKFNFLYSIEFFILLLCVFSVNFIFFPREKKEVA